MAEKLESYHFYEEEWDSYDELYETFEWEIPDEFNIAEYVCDRWVDGNSRVALFTEYADGGDDTHTFWQLQREANQFANFLDEHGIGDGDRVAVSGIQRPETLITYLGAWKAGAVTVPLSALFGPEGLSYRLRDADVSAFVVDSSSVDALRKVEEDLPALEHTLLMGDAKPVDDEVLFSDTVAEYSPDHGTATKKPDDTASILYTSGTTGAPKGTQIPHQVVLGGAVSFMCGHCNLEGEGVLWMPVEWSWVGLYAPLLANLFYGSPVVGFVREGFEPEAAFELIEKYGINRGMFPPSALRMMMQVERAEERYDVSSYESMCVGGEEVGETVLEWVDRVFDGAVINAAFGQTEAIMILGECHALGVDHREGKIGRPYPGWEVEIVDPQTAEPTVETGEVGEIAVRYEGNPGCFLGYLNNPEKTEEKVRNGWLLTEDLGVEHEDGYISFRSRKDDVIISSGYRIGPGEIEDTLVGHGEVADVGVIGVPHDERGEVPKAFVSLVEGAEPSDGLREELQQYVKDNLAKYEYPRELEFVDELPRTTTGKKRRTDLRTREGIE